MGRVQFIDRLLQRFGQRQFEPPDRNFRRRNRLRQLAKPMARRHIAVTDGVNQRPEVPERRIFRLADAFVPEVAAVEREFYILSVAPQQHTLHGAQNAYCSAVAVYLSQNFSIEEAQERAARFAKGMMARTAEPQGRSMELYQAFVSAVEQCAKTNSDVAFYADCLNVSPRYLSQVCRKLGEKTPKQIIDTALLACIRQELMLTTHTFQEIAYGCGFSSQAHFSKFFKKLTGMTPSDFRRQNKE